MNARTRTGTALLALALNLPLWTTGCGTMTTDFTTSGHAAGLAAGAGAFGAAIFDREKDIERGAFTRNRVESELYREEPGGPVLVRRSEQAAFEILDLPPGNYRLKVSGWREGNSSESPSATRRKEFSIAAGKRVQANVVLNDYGAAISAGMIVAVGVGIAAVAAALTLGNWNLNLKFQRDHAYPPLRAREKGPCSNEPQVACEPAR